MDTSLLRLATRHRSGARSWTVPGYGNAAMLLPARLTLPSWGASFRWPAVDARGEHMRAVDLNRHLPLARLAARELIDLQK